MDQNWYTCEIWLGNNLGNFQLHRFIMSENIARKDFLEDSYFFDILYITVNKTHLHLNTVN